MELGLPCPQRVVQLPEIAWDQYTSGRSEFERDFCDKKRKTRQLKLIFDKGIGVQCERTAFNETIHFGRVVTVSPVSDTSSIKLSIQCALIKIEYGG